MRHLIDVYTDDIVLDVGTSPASLGKLILKHYKVPYSLLLVGTPECPFCARMAFTLNDTIEKVRNNTKGAAPFFAYSLLLTRADPQAMEVQAGLEIGQFPTLFVIDGRGDIIPLIPNYMAPEDNDPMGNGRLQQADDVLTLMARIQQQNAKKRLKQ